MWTLLIAIAVAWLALCAAAFVFQNRLIFFPGAPPSATPASVGLRFEDLRLRASDGVSLHAWWIPADDARGAVIVCHGNAGSIEHRLGIAQGLRAMRLSVLLFDYRGYGASEGRPSEAGLYLDAEAAYDHVAKVVGIAPERIISYGESLGGAVAAELALRRPVAALVLEAAFTSLADVGAKAYPYLPVRLLVRSRFDTCAKLARVSAPLLVLHSPDDDIVPCSHATLLRDAAAGQAELVLTSGHHNQGGWLQSAEYGSTVGAFFDRNLPAR